MYSPLQIYSSDLIHLVGVMKTKSKRGKKKKARELTIAQCPLYHEQVHCFMVQETVNTYLPNQPASACAIDFLLYVLLLALSCCERGYLIWHKVRI